MNWRAVGAGAVALALVGCSSEAGGHPRLLAKCEEVVTGALRSPSEYRRISVDDRSAENQLRLVIAYDAPNGFGAMVRGTADCRYESRDGTDRAADLNNIEINGRNGFDWMLNGPPR